MLIKVNGVVIRTQELASDNRLIHILTREKGLIVATAMGRRSSRSSLVASTQLFCYGEFVLYMKGERYWVREVTLQEAFLPLRKFYEKVALATYFCDVVHEVSTNEPDETVLRLLLNSLYALSIGSYDEKLVKSTFEWRVASSIGFMPDLTGCAECGESQGELFYLNVMDGHFLCASCHSLNATISAPISEDADDPRIRVLLSMLSKGALEAARYCISCPIERILSFRMKEDDFVLFCRASETYLLNHLERTFSSLEIYKKC